MTDGSERQTLAFLRGSGRTSFEETVIIQKGRMEKGRDTAGGQGLPEEMRRALARWAQLSGCRLMVLFGSNAAAQASEKSDIDLALSFEEIPRARRRLSMIGELQDLCGGRGVDVVFLRADTNPVLRFEIFRGGAPIYEARKGLFVDEAVRALVAYEDALPFRRELRRSLSRGERLA